MDGIRSSLVGDYQSRSASGSTSSSSSSKQNIQMQKRQRLEQITQSLEEPARTRNSLSSSRSSSNNQRSNKSGNRSTSNRRRPSSSGQSRSREDKTSPSKTRSKNVDDEDESAKQDKQKNCTVCKRFVRNTRDLKHCFKCNRCSHPTCNGGFIYLAATNTYACPECAKKERLGSPNSNNNTSVLDSNQMGATEEIIASDEETNRPSCSQSVHNSSDEEQNSTAIRQFESLKNVQIDGSPATKSRSRKNTRRPRNRSSPQQLNVRSNSSASEEQSSPVGNKLKTRISGSPSSCSIGISMTTAEPSNDVPTPSEISLSPESVSDANNSRTNANDNSMDSSQNTKPASKKSRKDESGRSRAPGQKKPQTAPNRPGTTMRTRFGGKPTPSVVQTTNLYSVYERSGKYERTLARGRKNVKGSKGGSRRGGGRGKVISAITKSRGRQPQSSSYGQNSVEDKCDSQGRLRSHDENDYVRTVIVTNANDKFMDSVSLCLICGSVGQDAEGSMLTCASCAQSYHIFCINSKPNSAILERGWRCLDCTVCEGCGSDKDESNLLLCDECDVSYHIYCLEPKLTQIPNGPWRCKWCATCCRCKKQVQSGLDLSTLEGYCETCFSLRKCPKCTALYDAGDLLIKCQHCIRWFHARCEDLMTEEQVENASENAFRCSFCRPKMISSYENSSLFMDNVMISRNTFDHVSTLRRGNTNMAFNESSYRSIDNDEYDNEEDPPYSSRGGRGRGGAGRRVLKLGVGGFHVRMPRQRPSANTPDEKDKDLIFPSVGDEGDQIGGTAMETAPGKRMRRPRRPRRPKIEDQYPPAIQEAFFGIQPVDSKSLIDIVVDEPVLGEHFNVKMEDKNRNLGCELSDQTADAIRVDDLGLFDNILNDDIDDLDIGDFSFFMDDDDDNLDATTSNQFDGGFNPGGGINNQFESIDGNFITDEHNDENNGMKDEEDSDITNEQFHAQMEQNHEKQRQIQQQARLQMGTSTSQPNGQSAGENGAKASAAMSNAEKINQATEKWEEDEPLGDKATKAAVLFANTQHAYLKQKFPLWTDRVKRINNLWRKLKPEDREVFVKKARENRADVPKRRNRRATSTATNQVGGSIEDLCDASQDSNHSNLDTESQHNGQRNQIPEQKTNFGQPNEPPPYPGSQIVQAAQPYKVANPRHSGDGANLNGMRMIPDPTKMQQMTRPTDLGPPQREVRNQAPVISASEWEAYNLLLARHSQVEQHRSKIDEELVKLRKLKKNAKAKVRSLMRARESLLMNNLDASTTDREIEENNLKVEHVTNGITEKQKVHEKCKHELKDISTQIQSFQSKYNLNQGSVPPTPNMIPGAILDPHQPMHFPPQHQPMQYPTQQTPGPLSSPTYPPFNAQPSSANPAFPPFRQNSYYESADNLGSNSFYPASSGNIRLSNFNSSFQQPASPVMSNPETPPSARPTSSASTEVPQKSGRGRKRRRPIEEIRTPKLGNVLFSSLTDPFEQEIYSVLDLMVSWVETAVDSGNEALFNKLPTMRTANLPVEYNNSNDCKVKRRRNIVKRPPGQEASEYEAFIDKLQNQLKLCPMPILTYEQSSFIDTSIPQFCDITKLQEEIGKEFISGNEIDNYHLTFMPDYYLNVEQQTPFDHYSLYPDPMSKIYADVDIDDLEKSEEPLDLNIPDTKIEVKKESVENEGSVVEKSANEEEVNEEKKGEDEKVAIKPNSSSDVDNYELFWRDITSDEVGNFYTIPVMYKLNNDNSELPIAPHRSVFKSQKSRHSDHRYAITLTIENMNLDDSVLKELQNLINNPDDLTIIEQTPPPESPQQAHEIKEEPLAEEITENVVEQMCRQCDQLIKHSRVAEFMTKLGIETTEDEELNTFCSMPCYLTYMAETNTPIASEVYKHASRFVDDSIVEQLVQSDQPTKRIETLPTEHELKLNLSTASNASANQARTSNLLSPIDSHFDPNYYSFNYSSHLHSNEQILRVSDLPLLSQNNRNVVNAGEYKWKGFGWQRYDNQIMLSFQQTQEDIHQKLVAIQTQCSERTRNYRKCDTRVCAFCREAGDGESDVTGRLLNVDANEWVHVNCALWSTEVFENENGFLKNVDVALKSAQTVQCKVCQRNGASLRCYKHNCDNSNSSYHLPCAKKSNAKFGIDKLFFCPNHEIRPEVCLQRLGTLRRICIEREETPLLAKIFNHSYPIDMVMRVGSLIFRNIGQVLPDQVKNFHSEDHIYPAGYHITRLFWSTSNVRDQARYECTISDEDGQPMFHVQMCNGQGRMFSDRTMAGAWNEIFQCVKRIRSSDMLQFYPDLMNASNLFGLQEPAITKIAESLPGVDQMFNYTISHENSPLLDLPLAVNPTGCARCEPISRTRNKHRSKPLITQTPRKKTPVSGNASNEFTPEIISRDARRKRTQRCLFTNAVGDEALVRMMQQSGITATMLMSSHVRYDTAALHNAHSQYKKMKQEWRNYVYLGRSNIQGLGLFAKRDLDMNTIIIEYVGEIIRSELGEVREKRYLSQNRAIYLFRIDEEYIIDATMTGGLARYVNHSCDPNCSTKILQYNDEKKIVIIANRPIKAGEELSYDYMFNLEDEESKIPCLCGAPNCVKWMN